MFTMDTQNDASGLLTTTRPGANPFQPDDELAGFLRDLAMRRRGPAAPPPERRGMGANANVGGPSRMTNAHDNTGAQMQALALRQKQGEVRDADSVRNLRKAPTMLTPAMGGGVLMQWDRDTLNPIQEKAVNPENSQILNGGLATPGRAGAPIGSDLAEFEGTGMPGQPQAPPQNEGSSFAARNLGAAADRSNREILERGDDQQRQQDERVRALYGILFGGGR